MANQFPTITSACTIHSLIPADTQLFEVGIKNPIALPLLASSQIAATVGGRIGKGDVARIHQVKDTNPERVYRIIPMENFKNGNEIRISNIAAETGVSPAVYGSFAVVNVDSSQFVFIEMDRVGKSLSQHRKDLYKEKHVEAAVEPEAEPEEDPALAAKRQALKEIQAKVEAEAASRFTVIDITQPELPFKETIETLYGSEEEYYCQLFTALQTLAKHKIAFLDTNCDNIIPTGKKVMLLDFDCAELASRVSEAASRILKSLIRFDLKRFEDLATTNESLELAHWFRAQATEELLYQLSL